MDCVGKLAGRVSEEVDKNLTSFIKTDSGPIKRTRAPIVGDFGVLQANILLARVTCSATSWLFTNTIG